MEQRSTTHSPRVDDAMAAETESLTRGAPVEERAEEFLLKEPLTDDSTGSDVAPVPDYPVPAGALDDSERTRRSELAASLRPSIFPASSHALLAAAHEENAPEWVIDALSGLPADAHFESVQPVWEALGGHRETRSATRGDTPADVQPPQAIADDQSAPPVATPDRTSPVVNAGRTVLQLGAVTVVAVVRVAARLGRRAIGVVTRRSRDVASP